MVYNRVKQLNGKKLESAVKHGATRQDLCREYGCSGTQLDRQISQIYNNRFTKIQEVWRALNNNDRQRSIENLEDAEKILATAEEVEARLNSEEESDDADTSKDTNPQEYAKYVKPQTVVTDQHTLERLVKELSRQGDSLMREADELDNEITRAQAQYDGCECHVFDAMNKVETAKQKVASAEEELRQKQQKYNELCGIAEEKFGILEDLKTQRAAKQREIDEIHAKIWDLTQITLGVDIETDDIMLIEAPYGTEVRLNYAGSEEIFNSLIAESECENFTIRELRLLALTIAVAKNLLAKVKVICDDQKFVSAFERFV